MEITRLTVHELQEKLKNKEITLKDVAQAYKDRIEDKEKDVQAFLSINDNIIADTEKIQEKIENGNVKGEFAGIPIGIKDNLCVKGTKTTCA